MEASKNYQQMIKKTFCKLHIPSGGERSFQIIVMVTNIRECKQITYIDCLRENIRLRSIDEEREKKNTL